MGEHRGQKSKGPGLPVRDVQPVLELKGLKAGRGNGEERKEGHILEEQDSRTSHTRRDGWPVGRWRNKAQREGEWLREPGGLRKRVHK